MRKTFSWLIWHFWWSHHQQNSFFEKKKKKACSWLEHIVILEHIFLVSSWFASLHMQSASVQSCASGPTHRFMSAQGGKAAYLSVHVCQGSITYRLRCAAGPFREEVRGARQDLGRRRGERGTYFWCHSCGVGFTWALWSFTDWCF